MSFIAWIVLGLLAGFIGSEIVNKQGEGLFPDILLGIVGAIAGGWLFNTFDASGVTGAVVGSVVLLVAYHLAKVLIADLEEMDGHEDHYDAKFTVVAENVRHHIKEEEMKSSRRLTTRQSISKH